MSEPDDAEDLPAVDEHRRSIDWRKVKLSGGTALTFVGLVAGGSICLRMLRWALLDGTRWTARDHVTMIDTPTTVVPKTPTPSITSEAPATQVIEQPSTPVASSRQPGPYSPAASVTTVPPNPASKTGMGDLWLNVCGSSSSGYRMCRGSTPTEAQRAADFPPGAKDL